MSKFVKDFLDFAGKHGIVGLAVGLAIGIQASVAVSTIVDRFINPIVGFILGGTDLSNLVWETGLERGGVELVFGWGEIASTLITLLATAFAIYWVINRTGLDKLDKK